MKKAYSVKLNSFDISMWTEKSHEQLSILQKWLMVAGIHNQQRLSQLWENKYFKQCIREQTKSLIDKSLENFYKLSQTSLVQEEEEQLKYLVYVDAETNVSSSRLSIKAEANSTLCRQAPRSWKIKHQSQDKYRLAKKRWRVRRGRSRTYWRQMKEIFFIDLLFFRHLAIIIA